jgi:hypothetical protein
MTGRNRTFVRIKCFDRLFAWIEIIMDRTIIIFGADWPSRLSYSVCSASDNFSFFSDPGNFFHPRTRFSYKLGTKKM